MLYEEELSPFYVAADLFLKPSYRITIAVMLPKLRQMGQSISNWEIRERLKKMLATVEASDFRVAESTLEEVQFDITANSFTDSNKVISLLDGVTFRAVGFTEPLSVKAERAKPDHPTRVDWDRFFANAPSSKMGEREPGERPDTVYIGGLPFEWFKTRKDNLERVIRLIFTEFGEIRHVDIPQCDPHRKQMEPEISGIQLSSWSYSQEPFFEAYIQFKEYAGFVNAMGTMCGKVLVQRQAGGMAREAKLRVDFDRGAHLSQRKLSQRNARRAMIESQLAFEKERAASEEAALQAEPEDEDMGRKKREQLTRQLIRAEKRQKAEFQRNYERVLRTKLKRKLTKRVRYQQERVIQERERGAVALMKYIAMLHNAQVEAWKYSTASVSDLASEYVREHNLPNEEALRIKLLKKRELGMRTKLISNLANTTQERWKT